MWYSDFYSGLLDHKYISLSIQYYLLARVGSRYIFNPVSGGLYHLAFEMFLKAYLRNYYSSPQLKSKFNHNIVKLWLEFKKNVTLPSLNEYDLIIRNLDSWERVRYIDLERGENADAIELVKGYAPKEYLDNVATTDFKSQKWFTLYIDDMDKLFKVIVDALEIPPEEFLKNPDFAHGKEIYIMGNKHNILENYDNTSG